MRYANFKNGYKVIDVHKKVGEYRTSYFVSLHWGKVSSHAWGDTWTEAWFSFIKHLWYNICIWLKRK